MLVLWVVVSDVRRVGCEGGGGGGNGGEMWEAVWCLV